MKDNNKSNLFPRRKFIGAAFSLATGLFLLNPRSLFASPFLLKDLKDPDSKINGVQIGVITYSYRSMPDQSIEALLKDIVANGISAVELMGDPAERYAGRPEKGETGDKDYRKKVSEWRATVSMDKYIQLRQMFNNAGVDIYAWKPGAFSKDNSDAEVNYAFKVAKALGARACTAEHPRGAGADAQTERLGKIAAQHKIYMAYHAHTQASPTLWDTALKQSKWNAINLDLGHWVAAGNPSPIPFIKKYHDRIESMHLKDRTTPAHGSKNLPWGSGDTPIVEALRLMRDQQYTFPASVELEYQIPADSNAVKEISKCVEYCRKALNS